MKRGEVRVRNGNTLRKMALAANVLNALEIFALALIILLSLTNKIVYSAAYFRPILIFVCLLLMVNNVFSFRGTSEWGRANEQFLMIREALLRVEELNGELRSQRHDFMNHLQVVYSLLQMNEPAEAEQYVEKLHGRMQSRALSMRTASPVINALLQAKAGECKDRGIAFILRVSSGWKQLPMPDWEMCRVLGNLIDNAMDALAAQKRKELTVELTEDLSGYGFTVANSGPRIAPQVFDRLFAMGFTTKRTGQGLGLHIVKTLIERCGGTISAETDDEWTVFTGRLPLLQTAAESEKTATHIN